MRVWSLVYSDRQTRTVGEVVPIDIAVTRNERPATRLGFFEHRSHGMGEQWRAACWMAAVVAFSLTETDLASHTVTFETPQGIDGPSAGALTTVGVMAALGGHDIPDDVTMTGSINPDGTLGPVSGLPLKLEAAARAGRKRVLIPADQRVVPSHPDGPPVDPGLYKDWRDLIAPVFDRDRPFDFGRSTLHLQLIQRLPRYKEAAKSFSLPVHLMLVQRTFAGLYANLRTLGARVRGGRIVEQAISGQGDGADVDDADELGFERSSSSKEVNPTAAQATPIRSNHQG